MFLELWRSEGVDASGVIINGDAHTGIYFVTHGADGHEFSYMRAGSAASRMGEVDMPLDRIRAARVLHVSGISQAISSSAADAVFAAIDVARRRASRLLRYQSATETLAAAARAGDHPRGDAARRHRPAEPRRRAALTGLSDPDAIVDFYLSLGARIVVLKLGRLGALIATDQARERIAARAVKAVDATGAGDCFDGTFLAEFVRGGDAIAAARFANVAAGLSTLRLRRRRALAAPGGGDGGDGVRGGVGAGFRGWAGSGRFCTRFLNHVRH